MDDGDPDGETAVVTPDESQDPARALHEHLAATAELPLETSANRWLGEAEAVAADALAIDDPAVARERVAKVRELLSNVDGTGSEAADQHVRRARELAAGIVDED